MLLLLAVACYVMFFHGMGSVGFIGPDEPRYAAVARDMVATGDYITPRFNGMPWFEKPVLTYWMTAIGYALFGQNEWGARFPSALGATLSVFAVYLAGWRLWGWKAGIIAAMVAASSVGFVAFAHAASTDMPLTACLTIALACFLVGTIEAEPMRRRWFYGFYAALGLGALAKGPIAFVLPGMSLALFIALRREWGEWKKWHPEGALIALGVALPWYLACTWRNGYTFIQVFLINQNFQRFTSEIHGHSRPFYFYAPVLLMLTFPWTFLLIPALRRRFGETEQLLGLWAIVPIVFFSFSGAKLPGYILPVVPAVALLCARELVQQRSRTFSVGVFIEAGTMAFIGVAFGFYGPLLNIDAHVEGMWIATATFVLAALLVAIALWLRPRILVIFNAAAMAMIVLAATSFVLPRFDRTDTMRPWKTALDGIVPPDQVVVLYKPARWMVYGLQYYRNYNSTDVYSPEELAAVVDKGEVFCIAPDSTLLEISRIANIEMKIEQTIANQTAFRAWRAR
jgi:4-amino-4-deoxy-L-arabinose transferase-like glycosyltransferase